MTGNGASILTCGTPGLRTLKIPPPLRLLGKHYYRGYLSVRIGEPGIGKSFFDSMIVAVATGCPIAHGKRPPGCELYETDDNGSLVDFQPLRIAVISNDLLRNAYDERLQVAMIYYEVTDRMATHLAVRTIDDGPLLLGLWTGNDLERTEELKRLRTELLTFKPDIVHFDPVFDNYQIDEVNAQWRPVLEIDAELRQENRCATSWNHHTPKERWGKPILSIADARGGGAIIGKAMVVESLSPLGKGDLEFYGFAKGASAENYAVLRQFRNNVEEIDRPRLVEKRIVDTVAGGRSRVAIVLTDEAVNQFEDAPSVRRGARRGHLRRCSHYRRYRGRRVAPHR